MDSFDYAMGLFSVLTALALGDIAISFHRLLRFRHTVRWDIRAIVSAALVTVTLVRMWFAFWNVRASASLLAFPFYVSIFLELMLLFLIAAACLPDDPPNDCDLSQFYESNRIYLWLIFLIFEISYTVHGFWFDGLPRSVLSAAALALPLACYAALIGWKARWLHVGLPLLLIAYQLADRWSDTLSAA